MNRRIHIRDVMLALVLAGSLAGCGNGEKAAIENVLLRDTLVTYQLPFLDDRRASKVIELMQKISLAEVPREFADAYQAHIAAWRQSADVAGKDDKVAQEKASKGISSTYDELKSIAARYGAQLPPDGLLGPASYVAESATLLAKTMKPDMGPAEWKLIGNSDAGCEWSYKSPVTRIAGGVRFWAKANCESPQAGKQDNKSFEWKSLSERRFIECANEKMYLEYGEYRDESGKLLEKHEADYMGVPVDGPLMASQGIGGQVIGQNSLFRKVLEATCSN